MNPRAITEWRSLAAPQNKNSNIQFALAVLMVSSLPLLGAMSTIADTQPFSVSTKGGLVVTSADEQFEFKLGGRLMWDTDTFDGVLNNANGGARRFNSDLRRSRLEMSGRVYQDWQFNFDVDYRDGSNDTSIHTVGITYSGWEPMEIFVGRTKEPFGLEELTSSKSLSSIERNYFTEATDVDSQPQFGVLLSGMAGKFGWAAGLFNPNGNPSDRDGGDRMAFTGRLFTAPINSEDQTLHVGIAYSDRNLDLPLTQNGFKLDVAEAGGELNSSAIAIDEDKQYALEGLYIAGPLSLQSEYAHRDMGGALGGPDGEVDHFYLQATYTLTGERRGYKAKDGIADIVKGTGPRGAVELVAKYDNIDFAVDGRATEEVQGYLVGANWYVNRNVKLMLNYVRVSSDNLTGAGLDDNSNVISTRLQLAF